MTRDPDPTDSPPPYTLRSIQQMLGISRGVISGLIGAGFVVPSRGPRHEYRFSFQDVVLLRTAYALQAAKIPPRRIVRSLEKLKASLPAELPLSGLRITAVGQRIAVREGGAQWEPDSGQLVMDFEVAPQRGSVSILPHAPQPAAASARSTLSADQWFARAEALEASDKPGAEAAYRHALALAPDHADAYLNLGAMMCEAGRCDDAVSLYREALGHCPDTALLHFNLAIALEDQGRIDDALASYEHCLRLDATIADAHFNAARLHEQLGHAQLALRHFSAYRRLHRGR
jgi:tetratricopeptide (TPR) repeat protein